MRFGNTTQPARRAGPYIRPGCLALVVVSVVAIFAGSITPPNHDVLSAGSRAIDYQAFETPYGPIAPTTSLPDARCQAWRHFRGYNCPDGASLAREFWPALREAQGTLYVGLTCYAAPAHFNVEYTGASVILHCHAAASWIQFEPHPMGETGSILFALVMVPTAQMRSGTLSVYQEDRVERWLNDQVTITQLGTVTVNG